MSEINDWEDLRLFLFVARQGGLTAAAKLAKVSPPTLGRRMIALEQQTSCRLFVRHAKGYELTGKGLELLERAEEVEAAVQRVERWRDTGSAGRIIRISAGTWMTRFLASHIEALVTPDDHFGLSLLVADQRLDIARREVAIGIRNAAPSEAWLAGRKIGAVAFAPYVRSDRLDTTNWIGGTMTTPSAQWARSHHGRQIVLEVNAARTVLDLALHGVGHAVLPCFVGDLEPGLVRSGDEIAELRHDQWLVTHHDDRHDQVTRTMLRRLRNVIASRKDLFLGAAHQTL